MRGYRLPYQESAGIIDHGQLQFDQLNACCNIGQRLYGLPRWIDCFISKGFKPGNNDLHNTISYKKRMGI